MKCYGEFRDDRICDLCQVVDSIKYNQCLEKHKEAIECKKRIRLIVNKCIHRTKCWDEYTPFTGCNKNGKGHGRHAEDCDPKLECEKYCYEKINAKVEYVGKLPKLQRIDDREE